MKVIRAVPPHRPTAKEKSKTFKEKIEEFKRNQKTQLRFEK